MAQKILVNSTTLITQRIVPLKKLYLGGALEHNFRLGGGGRVWKFKRTLIQKLNACKFAQRGLGGGDC